MHARAATARAAAIWLLTATIGLAATAGAIAQPGNGPERSHPEAGRAHRVTARAHRPSPAGAALRPHYSRPPAQWPRPWLDPGILAALPGPPTDDRTTDSAARIAAGARLFFDPALSADGTISCATCHAPRTGWTVPTRTGQGRLAGRRNPTSLLTVAGNGPHGWAGQSHGLDERLLAPLTDAAEMGNRSVDQVIAVLRRDPSHAEALRDHRSPDGHHSQADDVPDADARRTLIGLLRAFVLSLDRPTAFDRFVQGDHRALDDLQIEGLHLFRTKARCIHCHHGPRLTDDRFHNLGISFYGEPSQDLGRHEHSGRCEDAGAFRTASLRHVSRTAPYMHNGLFETLPAVVRLYVRGGGELRARNAAEAADPLRTCAARVSPLLKPLPLDDREIDALVAFLESV